MNILTRRRFLGAAGIVTATGLAAPLLHARQPLVSVYPGAAAPLNILLEARPGLPSLPPRMQAARLRLWQVPSSGNQYLWLQRICAQLTGQRVIAFTGDTANLMLLMALRERGASVLLHARHQIASSTPSYMTHDVWVHDHDLAPSLATHLLARQWRLEHARHAGTSLMLHGQSPVVGWRDGLVQAASTSQPRHAFNEAHVCDYEPIKGAGPTTLSLVADL